MRIKLTLTGTGGELAAELVDVPADGRPGHEQQLSAAVVDFVEDQVWAVGDTLTITEAE
jgi:hypothetical protein